MKSSYRLYVNKVLDDTSLVSRSVLEQPEHEQQGTSRDFRKRGVTFRGWVLLNEAAVNQVDSPVELYFKGKQQPMEQAQRFPVELKRSDVIRHFYDDNAKGHEQLACGFEFETTFEHDHLELGFVLQGSVQGNVQGKYLPAFTIEVKSSLTVLHGEGPWLFLDNDTNGSVGQHTGDIRLNRQQRKAWKQYMKGVQSLALQQGIGYCLLVAPAKEAVFFDKHPLPRAHETVMDDMTSAAPKGFNLVYPVAELREMSKRSFRVTDTHWTSPGAAEASILAVAAMGDDADAARQLFSQDKYRVKRVNGDLGIKTFPPTSHNEQVLQGYRYRNHLVYDNGLPNFGRVMVINNPAAIYAKRCLILGSSSAYSMLAYLSRVYRELVLVHCAGNVDEQLVANLEPDVVLLQTNARFVVRAPACEYSLEDEISDKLARLKGAELRKLEHSALQYADNLAPELLPWVTHLHAPLLRALTIRAA